MAKNKKFDGKTMEYSNTVGSPSDISSGDIIKLPSRIAVALVDIPAQGSGSADLEGVYELPKDNTVFFTQGDKLYYDEGQDAIVKTDGAGANVPAGIAWEDAATSDTVCLVRLQGA